MATKRRVGRPKHGESTIADMAASALERSALRLLLTLAANRGWTFPQLCKLTGRDPSTLRRSIDSGNPRNNTLAEIGKALGLSASTIRAILGVPTDRDVEEHLRLLIGEVVTRDKQRFANPEAVVSALEKLWQRHPDSLHDCIVAFILARNEILSTPHAALGPILGSVDAATAAWGFSLATFTVLPKDLEGARREAWDWYHLMRQRLGMTIEDEKRLMALLRPYQVSPPERAELALRRKALAAAEAAYTATLRRPPAMGSLDDDPAEVLFDRLNAIFQVIKDDHKNMDEARARSDFSVRDHEAQREHSRKMLKQMKTLGTLLNRLDGMIAVEIERHKSGVVPFG